MNIVFILSSIGLGLFNTGEASLLLIGMKGTADAQAWRNLSNISYCTADIIFGATMIISTVISPSSILCRTTYIYTFASNLVRCVDFFTGKEGVFCMNSGLFIAAVLKSSLAAVLLYYSFSSSS